MDNEIKIVTRDYKYVDEIRQMFLNDGYLTMFGHKYVIANMSYSVNINLCTEIKLSLNEIFP
jgi:hypothetical protein